MTDALAVAQLLKDGPAFEALDPVAQAGLTESLAKVTDYLTAGTPVARQPAPDLRGRLRPQTGAPTPAPAPAASGPAPAPTSAPVGPTGRVGEVARATLNAIDFPEFVASLIQGTFQAIVDASIQQMEAYAELLKNVATTVDRFMGDHITDDTARDYLADQYPTVYRRETNGGAPRLAVDAGSDAELPTFFQDLGFTSTADIDDDVTNEVVIPHTRRTLAEQRQQTLSTMVMMGINRVMVRDGEITARLQFHIDASETTGIKFDQTKTTNGNMSGRAGRNPFSANALMVNTTSLNAQSDINVRSDLTGQVTVRFENQAFPLERFADSAAIQLINSNAKVPQPAPAPAPGQSAPPPAAPAPAVAAPSPAPAAATQALPDTDPWAPET